MVTLDPSLVMVNPATALSCTVTLKLQLLVLPLASLAVHCTNVVPGAKVEPEAGTQLIVGEGSQSSVAVALKLTAAPAGPVHDAVIGAGQLMFGATRSATVSIAASLIEVPMSLPTATV